MKITENLKDISKLQRNIAAEIDKECQTLENSDIAKENNELSAQIANLQNEFDKINKEAAQLIDQNSSLKNTLYEHIFNEKVSIVNNTAGKLKVYFSSEIDGELDKLSNIERNVKERIKNIKDVLEKNNLDIKDEFNIKLDELSVILDKKVTELRVRTAKADNIFSDEEKEQLDALKKEEITEEQIIAVSKKNNIERFVGLNVLNVIGISLLVIGSITAMRYAYFNVSDILKSIMIFSFGAIMLVVGEYLNQKKPNAFSLGISAGGIAIMFAALAISYFYLQVLPMYLSLVICVALTMGSFTLSVRYNSQLVAVFALVGGYIPFFSILENRELMYAAMAYFAILNLFALGISWSRKWRVAAFFGLILNILVTFIISIQYNDYVSYDNPDASRALIFIYASFAFLIYTAIPIIGTYHTKARFKKSDIVLLSINTVFSALIIYVIFLMFDMEKYTGLLAVSFAAVYILLSIILEKKFSPQEKPVKVLFYLTSIAFVALIIPMQFGRMWLTLGWLAEGVALSVYGILKDDKKFKKAGAIICSLCLGVFLLFDLMDYNWSELFVWKYTAITLASLIILGVYMAKKMMNSKFASVYKYFVIANFCGYIVYIIHELGKKLLPLYANEQAFQIRYLVAAASVTAIFLVAYFISRIKMFSEFGIKILSIILYGVGIIWMFTNNVINRSYSYRYFSADPDNYGLIAIGIVILIVLGVLSVLAMRDAMKIIITQRRKGIEFLPLVVSGYFVVLLSQNLVMQFNLSFSSAVISIIYVLAAFAWIVYGFIKRFAFIRRFGLILAIFAVIKLFIVDLSGLTQGFRIFSYFALGITLVAISFVYQFFSKKLELLSLSSGSKSDSSSNSDLNSSVKKE